MYGSEFKHIDETLRQDPGCNSELDYMEQTSWVMFLKYLDEYETEKETAAQLHDKSYTRIIRGEYGWSKWAAPKLADGSLDRKATITGNDLRNFVNNRLFPHLASFKKSTEHPGNINCKIGEIFSELRNRLQSGRALRDIVNKVDKFKFIDNKNRHELRILYEDKIKTMGNAGRNGGEYYTPRPLVKSIVKVINPKIGETVYDGAVGSAGFLCEACNWMRNSSDLSAAEHEQFQARTFYGREKKSLACIIGIMNMILHGVDIPNIAHTNTLAKNLADIHPEDRVDVVLANPPFNGREDPEVQQNFPIRTSETTCLFLQHFIKMLAPGGRCGMVVKNTFLSNTDNASVALRKKLLEECNLFTMLDLPRGTFAGSGVKTVVLFFEKGKPTNRIWYYQLNPDRKIGKTSPLSENDLREFVAMAETRQSGKNSWLVNAEEINNETWDLSSGNPNQMEETDNRTPQEIIAEIEELDTQAIEALRVIKELL